MTHTTTLREAAQQALEALELALAPFPLDDIRCHRAAEALRAALAEPVQEPVAWMDIDENGNRLTVRQWSDGNRDEVPLYTAPRKPLTDEEIDKITVKQWGRDFMAPAAGRTWARAIERAHGIGESNG